MLFVPTWILWTSNIIDYDNAVGYHESEAL